METPDLTGVRLELGGYADKSLDELKKELAHWESLGAMPVTQAIIRRAIALKERS